VTARGRDPQNSAAAGEQRRAGGSVVVTGAAEVLRGPAGLPYLRHDRAGEKAGNGNGRGNQRLDPEPAAPI